MTAAELPDGSVVASRNEAFIRDWPGDNLPWSGTMNEAVDDAFVDMLLARPGTSVLRVGYGDEPT